MGRNDVYLVVEIVADEDGRLSDFIARWIVDDLLSLGFTVRESLGDAPNHDLDTVFVMGRVLPIDRHIADQIVRKYSVSGARVRIDDQKMIREFRA